MIHLFYNYSMKGIEYHRNSILVAAVTVVFWSAASKKGRLYYVCEGLRTRLVACIYNALKIQFSTGLYWLPYANFLTYILKDGKSFGTD